MKDKVRGAIIGVAIGDALGMPAEGLSPEKIKEYYGKISTYRTPKKKHLHNLKRGQWTDDTQLTLAVGESIVNVSGIDFEDIACAHANVFNGERRGWGGTTKQACQRLLMGDEWWETGVPGGAGNGPPMKIAPIGVLYGLKMINLTELIGICINISKMTHGDVRAAIAAISQAYLIGKAMTSEKIDDLMVEISHISKLTRRIEDFGEDSLTGKFELMNMCVSLECESMDIRKEFGAGAFVNESMPFTYAMILKYYDNLEKCIEEIVNMGGDCDTNASMAASLLGAFYGYKGFPQKWRKGLEDRKRLVNLADNLYEMSQ